MKFKEELIIGDVRSNDPEVIAKCLLVNAGEERFDDLMTVFALGIQHIKRVQSTREQNLHEAAKEGFDTLYEGNPKEKSEE